MENISPLCFILNTLILPFFVAAATDAQDFGRHRSNCFGNLNCSSYHHKSYYSLSKRLCYYKNVDLSRFAVSTGDV